MNIQFPSHCVTGVRYSTIPLVNLRLVAISYQIALNIEDSILLCGFELVDEALDVFGLDERLAQCRSD